jgi:hypothetical protein
MMDSMRIAVNGAVRGCWKDVFGAILDWPREVLDGARQDCPQCGSQAAFVAAPNVGDHGVVSCLQCFPLTGESRTGIDAISRFKNVDADKAWELIARAIGFTPEAVPPATPWPENVPCNPAERSGQSRESSATRLLPVLDGWQFWTTPEGESFATIPAGNHNEHWPIKSERFKSILNVAVYERERVAVGADTIATLVNTAVARAEHGGMVHEAYVRTAGLDGAIYLDLADADWSAVRITADGWSVVDNPPARFRRSKGMLPLPTPKRGGRLDELRMFLNVGDEAWTLVAAWLVQSMRPTGPYPILALSSEQGSGKTSTAKLLRSMFDPSAAPVRAEPRNVEDMLVTARNSWCMVFDNLSRIPSWLSDALCRLATDGAFSRRTLFTDGEETVFRSQRPVLLTSITDVATRPDLLDRCIVVDLPPIPEERRRTEAELWAAFKTAWPRILGALLDAVSVALRELTSVKLAGMPRMADFAVWATAAESGLGLGKGEFLKAYSGNRESTDAVALEASVVARPLLDLLAERGEWDGSASELLRELEAYLPDAARRHGWPRSASAISGEVKRVSPNLRIAGWDVAFIRNRDRRSIAITRSAAATGRESPHPMRMAPHSLLNDAAPTGAERYYAAGL